MIFWILSIVAILVYFVGKIILKRKRNWDEDWVTGVGFVSLILILGTFVATCIVTGYSIYFIEESNKIQQDIKVLEERYGEQKEFVLASVAKYPLEEGLLKSFDPTILFTVPEIKSDKVVVESINTILSIQDVLYNKKMEANEVNKYLRIYRNYWIFIPTVIRPEIEKER